MEDKCALHVDDPEYLAYPCGVENCSLHDKKELIGYSSGDNECFCFDVKKDIFLNLTGKEPTEFEKAAFHIGHYRLYPEDVLSEIFNKGKKKIGITKSKKDNKIVIVLEVEQLVSDPKEEMNWDE